jgi:protein SCO1
MLHHLNHFPPVNHNLSKKGKTIMRFLAAFTALAIAMCIPSSLLQAQEPAPIHFTLTDQNGKVTSDKDFDGRYMLIFFGYLHCPDICPTTLQEMAVMLHDMPEDLRTKVAFVFVTGDPQRDTPEAMKPFIANFDSRIIGLSGTTQAVDALAWSLKAVVIRQGNGTGNYNVDHSTNYILLHDGKILDQMPSMTMTPEQVIARLKQFIAP